MKDTQLQQLLNYIKNKYQISDTDIDNIINRIEWMEQGMKDLQVEMEAEIVEKEEEIRVLNGIIQDMDGRLNDIQ